MPVEPNLDSFQWLFIRGTESLGRRVWETSEQAWVWSVRFLAWKYLVQLSEADWTWTEDAHTLPKGAEARELRRAAIYLLRGQRAVRTRRNPDRPWRIEMKASARDQVGRTLEKLWDWLSDNTPDRVPSHRRAP